MDQLGHFIINHWILWLAFISVLALTFVYELISNKNKARQITPQAAIALVNNDQAIIIDLRDKEAFKNGHIINAINAKDEDFALPKMNKYKNKKIILVCTKGIQSITVAAKIQVLGFDPLILNGGITGWQAADLPLVKN